MPASGAIFDASNIYNENIDELAVTLLRDAGKTGDIWVIVFAKRRRAYSRMI